MFNNIYKNKIILITGHTGFKGSWLSIWLKELGAKVYGIALKPPTNPSHYKSTRLSDNINEYIIDVNNINLLKSTIQDIKPEFVFHLAAQALVRKSYSDPKETIQTNALGTSNILESIISLKNKVTSIIITSDKVYFNKEISRGYKEIDLIGGIDPYSASKGMAELAIKTYFESFMKGNHKNLLGIARAGNVIGGGDWAQDRIVPDCIRAWSNNKKVNIRNLYSTRPWQHVLEPLSGYLMLGMKLNEDNNINGEAYNFGPHQSQNKTVLELIEEMSLYWENASWFKTKKNSNQVYEAGLLKLNCKKAKKDLLWEPNLNFSQTIEMTAEWYREFYFKNTQSMYSYTLSQINKYYEIGRKKNLAWTK